MKRFDDFMDLTGNDRELNCVYHGKAKNLHLEGRILSETDSELSVGVSLWKADVSSHSYDQSRNSLDIWYQAPLPKTIRPRILPMEKFTVPKSIEEINVYDVGQKP